MPTSVDKPLFRSPGAGAPGLIAPLVAKALATRMNAWAHALKEGRPVPEAGLSFPELLATTATYCDGQVSPPTDRQIRNAVYHLAYSGIAIKVDPNVKRNVRWTIGIPIDVIPMEPRGRIRLRPKFDEPTTLALSSQPQEQDEPSVMA